MTIADGIVHRLLLRQEGGKTPSPLWEPEPEVNASRAGVSLAGEWPAMTDLTLLKQMLKEAVVIADSIRKGENPESLKDLTPIS
ncbi:MAG: hypothetical protein EPN91_02345 [Salinibacterium sp.]|nr:MAG: hypothetical protein EPN91_02345 [Salinibacterium sp.]